MKSFMFSMFSNLWLAPLSLLSFSTIYYILWRALVPWFCWRFLFVGVANKNYQGGNSHVKVKDANTIITEGDVLELSLLVLTWVMGGATAVVSIIVFIETIQDTMFSRSTVLIPWAHFGAWYYIVDTYAMFAAFVAKRNLSHRRLKTRLVLFARSKWLSLLHHFLLMVVGYPVIVNVGIRGYKGDFYAAALLAQDFSNPLLANAKIMRILGRTENVFYTVNGAVLIVVFLLVRVLNMPLCVLVYAAQYHHWRVMDALSHMRWSCFAGISTLIVIQTYWFMALLKLAGGVVRSGWKEKIK